MNSVRAFVLHKDRENFYNCDDHFAINFEKLNFVVADGSSSDFFSKFYSRILCDAFAEKGDFFNVDEITNLNEQWRDNVKCELEAANCRPGSFAYVHYQRRDPGCATICGMHIETGNNNNNPLVRFYVLGDSVLFFVPENQEIPCLQISSDSTEDFPFDPSVKFGYTPSIASSYSTDWINEIIRHEIPLEKGDFYILTDATAEWILHFSGLSPEEKFNEIKEINSQEDFVSFVKKIRDRGAHMDDMTLMHIHIDDLSNLSFNEDAVYNYREIARKQRNEELGIEENIKEESLNNHETDGQSDKINNDNYIEELKKRIEELENRVKEKKQIIDNLKEEIQKIEKKKNLQYKQPKKNRKIRTSQRCKRK